jgi:hypothetical protein
MAEDHEREPTQRTQPKGIDPRTGKPYEPVEIPIPTKGAVLGALERAAKPVSQDEPIKDQGGPLSD